MSNGWHCLRIIMFNSYMKDMLSDDVIKMANSLILKSVEIDVAASMWLKYGDMINVEKK